MRVGVCASCGYMGYIDYPTKAWIHEFYLSEWRNGAEGDTAQEVARLNAMAQAKMESKHAFRIEKLKRFLECHPIEKNKPMFEIGCGYGESMIYFKERGYDVRGCENSGNRAEIVQKAYGLSVTNAPFEDPVLQETLRKSRFGFIFSHHVFEHVYDPRHIIKLASELQSEGDYIAIAVPDAYTEPSIMTLLHLPHSNAFTKQSLATLFAAHGYEVADDFSDKTELYLVGRRVRDSMEMKADGTDYMKRAQEKLTRAFGLGKTYLAPLRRLWCYRFLGYDGGGQVMHSELLERMMGERYRTLAHKLLKRYIARTHGRVRPYIACIVKNVKSRYVSYKESPIEIQFDGDITMLTK